MKKTPDAKSGMALRACLFALMKCLAPVVLGVAMMGCQSGSHIIPYGLSNGTKSFTAPLDMNISDWSDPAEMERAWQAALVRIPEPGGGFISTSIANLHTDSRLAKGVWPTVIYMHGCAGIWSGTLFRINFLAQNGFAVIAPASLARLKYPQSCRPETHEGGLYRSILRIRQSDAGYAIAKAKELAWVNDSNVFLMGLSEGGITTATFVGSGPEHALRARIIEGWTCRAGWTEYSGIKAPEAEPVLALVGAKDPWFQDYWNKGSCDQYLDDSNGSLSMVYDAGYLQSQHALLEYSVVQKTVLSFLSEQIKQ